MNTNQLGVFFGCVTLLAVVSLTHNMGKKIKNGSVDDPLHKNTGYVLYHKMIRQLWQGVYKHRYFYSRTPKYTQVRLRPVKRVSRGGFNDIFLIGLPFCSDLETINSHLTIQPKMTDKVFLFKTCYCWEIHSKMSNWKHLVDYYGINHKIMPKSYRLDHHSDYQRFLSNAKNNNNRYLVKLDIDKKKGLYLYENLEKSDLDMLAKQPSLIQKIQPDPLLVNGFRTSFRFYFVILCAPNKKPNIYLFRDGLVQVSLKPYRENSKDLKSLLAGYPETQSRLNYDRYHLPRTYQKLLQYYRDRGTGAPVSQEKLVGFFQTLLKPYLKKVCSNCKVDPLLRGQIYRTHIYGADIGFHRDEGGDGYRPYLYELNRGPQLSVGQSDWKKVIKNLFRQLFVTLEILDSSQNGGNQGLIALF